MGLKQDLINAKKEGMRLSGASVESIEQANETLDAQCELEKEAIVNFLTSCEFRITKLNAPVVLEDFKLPPQLGDVLPTVQFQGVNAGGPLTALLSPNLGTNGVSTNIDVNKSPNPDSTGILESSGYVFIGQDPDSNQNFNVDDTDGQIAFTTVKLIREDIEDLL